MREFNASDLHPMDWSDRYCCWFEQAMVSACSPVFDDCHDNYAVEARLRKAGVLTRGCYTDTESCALVVNFRSRRSGRAFLARLMDYLREAAGPGHPWWTE